MKPLLSSIFIAFSAGALGGLANAFAVWAAGVLAITAYFGVDIHPPLSPNMIYTRMIWGGIWGGLFLAPYIFRVWPIRSAVLNGLLFSLAPSAATLFYFMPHSAAGWLGLDSGALTPAFVLIFNAIWGVVGMISFRLAK